MLNKKKIAIIGAGHIAHAFVAGLCRGGKVDPKAITLSGPHPEKFSDLGKKYGVRVTSDNRQAAKSADIIFICVRPNVVNQVAKEIKGDLGRNAIIISVAAGVTFGLLNRYFLGKMWKIVRVLPNIPIAFGKGVVAYTDNGQLNKKDNEIVGSIFSPLGIVVKCKNEEEMNRLNVITGCGTGYVAYFIDAVKDVAKSYGFGTEMPGKIAMETFWGTLYQLKQTNQSPQELVTAVATKGGITEEIINNLEKKNFRKILKSSIDLGLAKMGKVTKELEKDQR
ncbi:pyrroline-5-carboxylate reductase [Patescibacteria group bacterium]|nr:pyrroline-5-carboxylate reductase [Patescibacteria group bacterium]